jgi:hypothetical protein
MKLGFWKLKVTAAAVNTRIGPYRHDMTDSL